MIPKLETADYVKVFAKQLIAEGFSFHLDDDFNHYLIFKKNKPYYIKEEADLSNELMRICFEFCEKEGADICDKMLEVSSIESEMDKFSHLPSQLHPDNN